MLCQCSRVRPEATNVGMANPTESLAMSRYFAACDSMADLSNSTRLRYALNWRLTIRRSTFPRRPTEYQRMSADRFRPIPATKTRPGFKKPAEAAAPPRTVAIGPC